jgi:hypothetical protein
MTSNNTVAHLRRNPAMALTQPQASGRRAQQQNDAAAIKTLSRVLVAKWHLRPYILFFCFGPGLALLLGSIVLPLSASTVLGQIMLGISTFASLWLLSDQPLLNPVQGFVFIFHWWFGVGPAVCAIFHTLAGNAASAEHYTQDHAGTLWVVALGLPLYAAGARITIRLFSFMRWHASFLLPKGLLYRPRTVTILAGIAGTLQVGLLALGRLGYQAYDTVNYLGGHITNSPFLAVISEASRVSEFAVVAVLAYLVVPGAKTRSNAFKAIAFLVLAVVVASALTSGTKVAIILPVFYLGVLFLTWRQRIPWLIVVVGALSYVLVIEPFVASSRIAAQRASATTASERQDLFTFRLSQGIQLPDWRDMNIDSPFRYIYEECVAISNRSTLFGGPWGGQSIRDGLSAIVPRVFSPDKADSNMGNYFAKQLNVSKANNNLNNIAITIPFEIVGNYGFLAGIGSFAVIGMLWAAFTSFLLTPSRLGTHPLAPYFVGLLIAMESSVGQFLNVVKLLSIPLAVLFVVWLMIRRQL